MLYRPPHSGWQEGRRGGRAELAGVRAGGRCGTQTVVRETCDATSRQGGRGVLWFVPWPTMLQRSTT